MVNPYLSMQQQLSRKLEVLDSLSGKTTRPPTLHQKRSVIELSRHTYNDFLKAIESEPPRNILILLGDFSARIGDDSHETNPQTIGRKNYNEKTNDNGKRLVA